MTAPRSVLIVDDQPLIRDLLANAINADPRLQTVGMASTIDEAHTVGEKTHPDVVIVDVLFSPSFFDSVSRLNEALPASSLVILDEAPHDVHLRQSLRVGAAGYLTKSQPLSQLVEAICSVASGEQAFSSDIAERVVLSDVGEVHLKQRTRVINELTAREREVLGFLARGYTVKQCADALGLSASTVDNHKTRLMKKLHVHKTVELVHLAMRSGILGDNGGSSASGRAG